MKEIDLDKYVGKQVVLVEYDNTEKEGVLYKITNSRILNWNKPCNLTPCKDGYFLAYYSHPYSNGICYRKSHIRKIYERR